jgi:hypothetical protein
MAYPRFLTFIMKIKSYVPRLYEQLINQEGKTALSEYIIELEKIPHLDYQEYCITQLNELTMGYGYIQYPAGLLALTAMHHKKRFPRPPTFIRSTEEELNRYFSVLKKAQVPVCERFIIREGTHWLSGQIDINEDGAASLLIIDSLGVTEQHTFIYGMELITIFSAIFPQHQLYYSSDVKQKAQQGCSVFALDDIKHLYSVSKYIDRARYPEGLFDFLKQNSEKVYTVANIEITLAHLPLHLLRTTQSKQLLTTMLHSTEAEQPLNKKGVTGRFFAEQKLGFVYKKTPKGMQLQNTRLNAKLDKMIKDTVDYLLATSFSNVQEDLRICTLDGFEQRIEQERVAYNLDAGL